jgi:hypothetical protein
VVRALQVATVAVLAGRQAGRQAAHLCRCNKLPAIQLLLIFCLLLPLLPLLPCCSALACVVQVHQRMQCRLHTQADTVSRQVLGASREPCM